MRARLPFRIAAVLFLLFAAGHTIGFLGFKPPSVEGLAVRDAMDAVQFVVKGSSYSYGHLYTGFGLTVTAYLLFSAFLAWHLGGVSARAPQTLGALPWAFMAVQFACFTLSLMYFFVVTVVFFGAVVVCLGWAAWQMRLT